MFFKVALHTDEGGFFQFNSLLDDVREPFLYIPPARSKMLRQMANSTYPRQGSNLQPTA